MLSHTVPKRLLKQFAYTHTPTNSLRLWKYESGREPFGKASPKTATTHERFFGDPEDAKLEIEVETTLAREIEEPVNVFLGDFCNPSFTLNETQRRSMTRYITLLFSRSAARREGSKHTQEILSLALEKFLQNEVQLLTVAAQWSLREHFSGCGGLVSVRSVVRAARNLAAYSRTSAAVQGSFVAQVRNVLTYFNQSLFQGNWQLITAGPEMPFILSDSPVVTWVRGEDDHVNCGFGFERPDVEVLLPVSPISCLHIAPEVVRNRPTKEPTVGEVNRAQATFAYQACFANLRSRRIDEIVQNTPRKKFGKDFFTVWHRDYGTIFYEILLGQTGDPQKGT